MEKRYNKKMQGYPHFFYSTEPLCEGARGEGKSAEREQDGGERNECGDGGREKEFSYRRIIPSHFLRTDTYEGARGSD